jgi:hypothetical protein
MGEPLPVAGLSSSRWGLALKGPARFDTSQFFGGKFATTGSSACSHGIEKSRTVLGESLALPTIDCVAKRPDLALFATSRNAIQPDTIMPRAKLRTINHEQGILYESAPLVYPYSLFPNIVHLNTAAANLIRVRR